jgi:hypothetical protein
MEAPRGLLRTRCVARPEEKQANARSRRRLSSAVAPPCGARPSACPRCRPMPRVPRRADAGTQRVRRAARGHAGRAARHRYRHGVQRVRAAGLRGQRAGLSAQAVRREPVPGSHASRARVSPPGAWRRTLAQPAAGDRRPPAGRAGCTQIHERRRRGPDHAPERAGKRQRLLPEEYGRPLDRGGREPCARARPGRQGPPCCA